MIKINENLLKQELIHRLKEQQAYHTSVNGVQHYVRCPYCGDSKNPNHGHFSIKIDLSSDVPMVYRCLKCSVSGLLTEDALYELDIPLNESMKKDLVMYTKRAAKKSNLVNLETENYQVPLVTSDHLVDQKLDYFNKRLGLDFDPIKAKNHKIILDFFTFIKMNHLITKEKNQLESLTFSMIQNLQQNYIGFLSCNNNLIIFRDITGRQKYRYFKLILNDKNTNPDSFFACPSSISLMYTHPIHVHVAEGTFDILSIKENMIGEKENHYFYASCGFGGVVILKYLIRHGMNTGIHLHLYSDRDKTDWNHKKYLSRTPVTEWIDSISIHRNNMDGEKDYGVPINNIKDCFTKIK